MKLELYETVREESGFSQTMLVTGCDLDVVITESTPYAITQSEKEKLFCPALQKEVVIEKGTCREVECFYNVGTTK